MKFAFPRLFVAAAWLLLASMVSAQDGAAAYIKVRSTVIALTHARVIDGRGHPAVDDQTVIIRDGKIAAVGPAVSTDIPADAKSLDLTGKSLLPGLVMLHEHLYFTSRANTAAPFHINEMEYSFPRLYLACGLTTMRTTGCIEPYTDLEVKARIDEGLAPGPKIHLTAPYIEGSPAAVPQLHPVDNPDDATRMVNYWADKGFTSFKLYMDLPRAEAKAAIDAAHARHLQVTGHLGAITYREAADLGIDNLEHGFFVATDFARNKKPDTLPTASDEQAAIDDLDVNGAEVTALLHLLIEKHVAITSTLPVFEESVPGRPILTATELDALSTVACENYVRTWARVNARNDAHAVTEWKKMLALEKRFYDAGGLLVAGTDPTGYGGVIAGYGSQREIELLVEAGLTPLQAIQVATYNGAQLLGVEHDVGSIEVGKAADLIVVAGNPAQSISDIREVEIVFKDGVGFDSRKLIDSVKGYVGIQ